MINPVEKIIRKYGSDDRVVFVFPSDIAASLWMEAALEITGRETLPSNRFTAWDRFKEQAVQAIVAGKQPVTSVLRKLYALDLAHRNAQALSGAGVPLFTSLIPSLYAESGTIFASWIARILPQLAMWEQRTLKAASPSSRETALTAGVHPYAADEEARDLALLKADYGRFLDEHQLFEPAWQKPPLKETGFHYVIFFPGTIEDYVEYSALLSSAPFIELILPESLCQDLPEFFPASQYETSREEFKAVALEVEALIRSGVKAETIALSVPELETAAPYILREFSLRGIPVEYRFGDKLGTRPAGRFFSLVQECITSNFTFKSVKALLLDRFVPWKNRSLAEGLVDFGIRNHCVTSWKDNGKNLDVWEEAFSAPTQGDRADWLIRDWYRPFRKATGKLGEAENFTDLRKRWFAFRAEYLDMDALSPEDDAVLARCVEELNALASLENSYPALIPPNPWSFFVSVLSDTNYVPQRSHGGVSIFPYRVAAGTPFSHHFMLDASQDRASVQYRQLSFLRQDKRDAVFAQETDASGDFFSVYHLCGARFSVSLRSFQGYSTPHSLMDAKNPGSSDTPGLCDPFTAERDVAAALPPPVNFSKYPDRLYPVQASGFAEWKKTSRAQSFSYLKEPFDGRLPALLERIQKRQMNDGALRVSQSDLNPFAKCNARWFLSRLLGIKEAASDAELLNERNLGLLYHSVLRELYAKIRTEDGVFTKGHIPAYRQWAEELAMSEAAGNAEFRGPLAAPLISTLAQRITGGIAGILEKDGELLDGYAPVFLEEDIGFTKDGIRYFGQIDRISVSPSGDTLVLIDYKSGKTPTLSDYTTDPAMHNADFQIPAYVYLAEESSESPFKGKTIDCAWFGDIKGRDYRPIINDGEEVSFGRKKSVSRAEFGCAMDSFRQMAQTFKEAVQTGNFTRPENLEREECLSCSFTGICRYTYMVRP